MGKGLAQKRRLKNFLKAKETKSGRLTMLPPPPEDVKKKGKRQSATSDMPRSLQRMLQLKAAAERKGNNGAQKSATVNFMPMAEKVPQHQPAPAVELSSADAEPLGDLDRLAPDATGAESDPLSSPESDEEPAEVGPAPTANGQAKERNRAQQPVLERQQTAGKGLKERKKEYLKKRKLKKKVGRQAGEEEDLEAQLAQDPHKPKFGEQAMAPIKVNLKRKHWDPNASQSRSSKRCTQIFEQQLANARQQGASQNSAQVTAAGGKGEQQGGKAKGKKALKPWQLKKEKLSQKAAQGVMQASAIEAYRNLKRSQDTGNGATLQSLKELVKRDADRSAQQAII